MYSLSANKKTAHTPSSPSNNRTKTKKRKNIFLLEILASSGQSIKVNSLIKLLKT